MLSRAIGHNVGRFCGMRLVCDERDFLVKTERRLSVAAILQNVGLTFLEGKIKSVMDRCQR